MAQKAVTEKNIKKYIEKAREKQLLPNKILDELEQKLVATIKKRKEEGRPPLTKDHVEKVFTEVLRAYHFSQVDPGSAVGTVAAQSIGEPGTQMSLPGTELVVVKQKNESFVIPIGDFVESLFDEFGPSYQAPDGTALLDVPESSEIYVLSLGNDERIHWQKLVQVSRHPPNGDLLRITTRSGRVILATFSHSFVIRQNNAVVPIKGEDLSLGDRIPLIASIPVDSPLTHLAIAQYLQKNKKWANSRVSLASFSGVERENKSDSSFADSSSESELLYPENLSVSHDQIPNNIELTPAFGWFIGAFLAGGSVTNNFLRITSDDEACLQKVAEFAESFGIRYHIREEQTTNGLITSIYLRSVSFANLFENMCGGSADEKMVPGWVLNAPDEFVSNLLRMYFDGKSNINVLKGIIHVSMASKTLRDSIALLLARLGIFATKSENKNYYELTIPASYTPRFLEIIGSEVPHKYKALQEIVQREKERELAEDDSFDFLDTIPGLGNVLEELKELLSIPAHLLSRHNKEQLDRRALGQLIELIQQKALEFGVDVSEQLQILNQAYSSDVIWDEIVKLEKIPSPTPFVYDFSVPGTETFVTGEGLVTHNTLQTYHYAGVAEFNVTLGLPRLIEIVDARRNPNTPAMWVYLEKNIQQDEEKAKAIAQQLELTKVEKVAKSIDIDLFENRVRIVLDPELMEDKGLTVDDVIQKLQHRRRQKVIADGYNVFVQSEKEEPILQDLQKLAEKVKEIPLKGLKGVSRAMIKVERHGDGEDDWEYYVRCEGSNFTGALRIPGVDSTRTTTNHIHEIAETLGIEAARAAIIREAKKVLDDQGLDVDIRHITLVADLMTHTGDIHQIGRHGVSGEKSSVFARAAFEVTVKHLLDAAIYGQRERLQGIVENVIVGQAIRLGTGIVDLAISPNYREFAEKPLKPVSENP